MVYVPLLANVKLVRIYSLYLELYYQVVLKK